MKNEYFQSAPWDEKAIEYIAEILIETQDQKVFDSFYVPSKDEIIKQIENELKDKLKTQARSTDFNIRSIDIKLL